MRLTTKQIEHTLDQIPAQAIPDDNPVMAQLNQTYGDHTFFLDHDGLHIVETVAANDDGLDTALQTANVVRLASWTDGGRTTLAAHEPEVTETTVDIGPE